MQPVDNRFLLIFDTSADMKKRLPAEQIALDTLLAGSMGGQMHPGDSIGVWTFGQDLRAGEFPLQSWAPENAAVIASNIMVFVGKQHYAKTGNFDVLQSSLNEVVENSDRLTVVIFCDGETPIGITPYDSGINQVFLQRQAERKKTRQPVAIGLRAQLGEYTGCTVSFPPSSVNLPDFPPLPQPPAPPVVQLPPPVIRAAPLIIVGTNVQTIIAGRAASSNNSASCSAGETNCADKCNRGSGGKFHFGRQWPSGHWRGFSGRGDCACGFARGAFAQDRPRQPHHALDEPEIIRA